ncbi:MAG: hypothetical protein ACR652_24680 [Methylocystis sp.]|uniref:hypothetical protein n=1 Tax=Methylocystis sp. TaxID=1911079 RepID=UPI003DA688A6
MPLNGLSALLGLSGGAQGVAQGLNQWGASRQRQSEQTLQRDQMAQQLEIAKANLAAQMAQSGFVAQPPNVPRGTSNATPSASNNPQFVDMHAHAPPAPAAPSVPEITNEQFGYSPTLDVPEQQPATIPPVQQQIAPTPSASAIPSATTGAPPTFAQPQTVSALGQQFTRPADYESPEMQRLKLAEQFRINAEARAAAAKVPTKVKVVQPDGTVVFVDPNAPPAGLKERGPAGAQPAMHEVTNPDGSKTLQPVQAGMQIAPPSKVAVKPLAAPIAAKVGQFGEMLKKYEDLTKSMESLDVGVGNTAARDLSEHGLHVPLFGTIPGTKGIGSALMNHTPEYARYQAALSPFYLAAAHALSGARINQDQVEQIRKSIEIAPGDFANKEVRAQKEKNIIDLINSIGGSLPEDAIADQENQMSPEAIAMITERGYKPRKKGTATPASSNSSVSDADFARAWAAGKRTEADIAAWVKANPKTP